MSEIIHSVLDPVYRIPEQSIDVDFLIQRGLAKFEQFQMDRVEWLQRREMFYLNWDDYLSPVYKGLWNSSSNLHLPNTEIKANAMHALILEAIFFIDPPFYVDPQEEADLERIQKIERKMKYIVTRYCNYHEGIFNAVDDWAWDLVTDGMGIFSRDWKIEQRRFMKVEQNAQFAADRFRLDKLFADDVAEKDFQMVVNEISKKPYIETPSIRTYFNGPIVCAEDPEFILFKGDVVDSTDLNRHETVIKVCYFSKNELMSFKANGFMDEDVVESIINRQPDKPGSTQGTMRGNGLRFMKDRATGIKTSNSSYTEDKYEFICVYDTVDARNTEKRRLADRLVYFIHPASMQLARWTYLDRITISGKLPLHMSHLYRRPRRSTGRGVVETLYSVNQMQDVLLNQSIDAGTIANNPMGAYRGNSSFDPDQFKVEPGVLFKTDDPNQDLRLLSWPINPNWSLPVQNVLQSVSDQAVAIGPTQMGQVGARVGPLRSTSGVNALNAGSDRMINVIVKRLNTSISGLFEGLYMDCVDRMPLTMEIPVVGMDGLPELDDQGNPQMDFIDKADLRIRVNFGLMANSNSLNRVMQQQNSMQMAQFLLQPAPIQAGIVKPHNIYEILHEVIKDMGKMRIDRFISKPDLAGIVPIATELMMLMQGLVPVVILADPEHQQKIEVMDKILQDPATAMLEIKYGKIAPNALVNLKKVRDKHAAYLQAQQARMQMANPTGMQQNPALGLNEGGATAEDQSQNIENTQNVNYNQGAGAPEEG